MQKILRFQNYINESKFITNITPGYYQEPKNVTKELTELVYSSAISQENVKKVNKFLKKNKGNTINLYHGTSSDIDLENEGILTTKNRTKKSYQSEPGYVYLSFYKDSAKLFGDIAYPNSDTKVVEVEIPISKLSPDKDQLYNKRMNSNNKIGEDLGSSLIYGNGFRVKGNIPPYMIKNVEVYKK